MCKLEKIAGGIEEKENDFSEENNLSFTPNPTSGKLKFKYKNKGVVYVYNIIGRVVSKKTIEAGLHCYQELDLSGLPDGCYIIHIKEQGSSRVSKVILNKKRR
jgi:hypothetical protein